MGQRPTATNAADSQADVAQAARRAAPGRCGGQRRFRRSASGSGAGSTTRSASTRWARTHARAAVTTRRSIARPGCTPGPRTTRPAARARASRSRARSACPSHGNASSSQVETTWKPCPSASSIVGATSGRREPVVTTAIGARPAAAASERHTGTPRSGASERNSTPPARRDPSSRAIDRPMGPSPTTTQDLPASALNAPRPNPTRSPNPNPNPNPSPSPNPSPFPRRHPPSGARVRSAPSHVRAAWRLPPRPRPGVRPAPRVARDRLCSASISATRSATRRSARCRGVRRRRSVGASPPRRPIFALSSAAAPDARPYRRPFTTALLARASRARTRARRADAGGRGQPGGADRHWPGGARQPTRLTRSAVSARSCSSLIRRSVALASTRPVSCSAASARWAVSLLARTSRSAARPAPPGLSASPSARTARIVSRAAAGNSFSAARGIRHGRASRRRRRAEARRRSLKPPPGPATQPSAGTSCPPHSAR